MISYRVGHGIGYLDMKYKISKTDDLHGQWFYDRLGDNLWHRLYDQLGNRRLGNRLFDQLNSRLWIRLGNRFRNRLGDRLFRYEV